MLAWLLFITHPVALAAFWWLPSWAARRDAAVFVADGSNDSKHYTFHRQRLMERIGIAVAVAGLASLPLYDAWQTYAISCAGLLCAGAGIWAYRFNPLLSVARNLPYVDKYYISRDPRAAWFPDRLLTKLGWQLKPVLTACLLAGIGLYLLALAAAFYVHHH